MGKYIVTFTKTEHAQITVYADSRNAVWDLANEYDEYDLNFYGGDIDFEVEEGFAND